MDLKKLQPNIFTTVFNEQEMELIEAGCGCSSANGAGAGGDCCCGSETGSGK